MGRLITILVLAIVVLIALVFATGGIPGLGGQSSPPTPPPLPGVRPTPSGVPIAGSVTVAVAHPALHTWRFVYTVHDSGKTPIAGFQINGGPSNLFHIVRPTGWTDFGSGVCRQTHPQGILIYWSTDSTHAIRPGHAAQFGFTVNTKGYSPTQYALSWQNAVPLFGSISSPLPSTLPTTGPCTK